MEREAVRVPRVDQLTGRRGHIGQDAEPGEGVGPLPGPGRRAGDGGPARPEGPIAPDDHVGVQPFRCPVGGDEGDGWAVAPDSVDRCVADPVVDLLTGRLTRSPEVLRDLRLAVEPDAATDEVDEVEVVPFVRPLEVDAPVLLALAVDPVTQADPVEHLDGRALQDARPDPGLDVVPGARLDDHRVDASLREEVREEEAGRAGADDGDQGAHRPSQPPRPAGCTHGPLGDG